MEDMVSIIRKIVQEELNDHRTAELGVVTKLYSHESGGDTNNYACNVKLKDSDLELQNVAISTQRIGAVAIPNIDDLVMIQFINGDVNSAVVTGRLYNDVDRPPVAKPHEFVYISPDSMKSDIRRVYMEFPNGNKLLLNDGEVSLEAGKTRIKFNHDGDIEIESNSKVKIKTKSDVVVDSGSKVEIKAKSDVKIDSLGNISLDSKGNIDIKALGSLSLDATDVSIKGKASSSFEAGAMAKIRGGVVTVGGQLTFSP